MYRFVLHSITSPKNKEKSTYGLKSSCMLPEYHETNSSSLIKNALLFLRSICNSLTYSIKLYKLFGEDSKLCTENEVEILYSVFTREKNTVQKMKLKSCTAFLREKKTGYRKRS
ncbi:hypothetical protein B9C57_09220 [Tenacibaculum maritimum]|nr:hypothetical protein B9C57_09220 [Tenacibaculum maritimum]